LEAFRQYARQLPNNCVFLVDTYDTLDGVRNAVTVGQELRRTGHEMIGVRLDSGDLAQLSVEARRILDEGGFPHAAILASNDLDEHIIDSLKEQGAAINVWGVGTRLVTACDDPALGGVFKLSAIRRPGEPWQYKVKLSEQTAKISTPGVLQVRRYRGNGSGGRAIADAIFDEPYPMEGRATLVDPLDMTRRKQIPAGAASEDLLVPVFRGGRRVYDPPGLEAIRRRVWEQLAMFPKGVKRFVNPHLYFVGLERGLHERKTQLILRERGVE
jgi:nicotinate phosphoribosyltransferase